MKEGKKEAGENKQSEKQYKNQSCILKANKFDFKSSLIFTQFFVVTLDRPLYVLEYIE